MSWFNVGLVFLMASGSVRAFFCTNPLADEPEIKIWKCMRCTHVTWRVSLKQEPAEILHRHSILTSLSIMVYYLASSSWLNSIDISLPVNGFHLVKFLEAALRIDIYFLTGSF